MCRIVVELVLQFSVFTGIKSIAAVKDNENVCDKNEPSVKRFFTDAIESNNYDFKQLDIVLKSFPIVEHCVFDPIYFVSLYDNRKSIHPYFLSFHPYNFICSRTIYPRL